ncbi:hypothetical protein K2173_019144 [Erythroxylum novogranatense]|uniref:Ubiquitin carboxyl-terminal hydrolase n=1 Tax=Erythroxylum novogranatense TaxID=1862640 RepID=A0AAV8SST4_9ROSI|nr:hypothetical protein K2173_019144 [Erythroxylum novogranatense]
MGKRVKKKTRALQKTVSPKVVPQESNGTVDSVNDGSPTLKDKNSCAHLNKGFDLKILNEKFRSSHDYRCEDCREGVADRRGAKGKSKHGKKKGDASRDSKSVSKAIWMCLLCGHYGCGGLGLPTTPQSHAMRHARHTRHSLVVQLENPHLRFCFPCNLLIPVDQVGEDGERKDPLQDVVKLIKGRSSEQPSVDVEDVLFGVGSVASETKEAVGASNILEVRSGYSVRGLVNLGNTCFFNSVLQNLLAMNRLRDYFFNHDAPFGPLFIALKKLFVESKPENGLKNVINPRSFFGCVCSKAPQFRGYQQQDSHELLRCLLDELSAEELASKNQVKASGGDSHSTGHGPTFVDFEFGGRISSTVSCIECGHSSTVYEPFLDLSLSVPTKKPPTKKIQPGSRAKKTKLPPKRGGRIQPKSNKDTGAMLAKRTSNPSAIGEPSCQKQSTTTLGESFDTTIPDSVGSTSTVDDGGLVSEKLSAASEYGPEQNSKGRVEETDDSCDFTWMDYCEAETIPEEQEQEFDNSIGQDSRCREKVLNDNLIENNQVCSIEVESINKLDYSSVNSWEEEVPLQVQSSEVLLLPYKEDSFINGESMKGERAASSSVVEYKQDEVGFDGFGGLFDEPEVSIAPVVGPSLDSKVSEVAFITGTCSDSDPDEVDNSESPVSVESCLAHFVKPELLSNDNAWDCENCSKILHKLEAKKKQAEYVPETLISRGGRMILRDENVYYSNQNCTKIDRDDIRTRSSFSKNGEKKDGINAALVEQSHSSDFEESQESFGGPAVDSCSVDMSTNIGCTDIKDQESKSKFYGNCESEKSEDEEGSCKEVNVKRDAIKRVLIDRVPPILTIHLKRFSQDARGRLIKLNGHVNFREILDLRPYIDPRCLDMERYVYHLVGVVEHQGTMRGGHYVAYVRGGGGRGKGKAEKETGGYVWYHASDAYVREASLEEVLGCEAYILFYENSDI